MKRTIEKDFAMQNLSWQIGICDDCPFKKSSTKYFDRAEDDASWVCSTCPNYLAMRSLADQLWDSKLEIRQVLNKGPAMSEQDILFLFDEGVTQRRIQEALEIDAEAMKVLVWERGEQQ